MLTNSVPHALLQGTASMGMMLLAGGLIGRAFCFRRQITVREARMTKTANLLFWTGSGVAVTANIWIRFLDAQAGFFRISNPFLLAQIAVFAAILGLDVWPTRKFRSWSRYLDLDQTPYFTDREFNSIRRLWRIQTFLLVLMPFFAPLIRTGIGTPK